MESLDCCPEGFALYCNYWWSLETGQSKIAITSLDEKFPKNVSARTWEIYRSSVSLWLKQLRKYEHCTGAVGQIYLFARCPCDLSSEFECGHGRRVSRLFGSGHASDIARNWVLWSVCILHLVYFKWTLQNGFLSWNSLPFFLWFMKRGSGSEGAKLVTPFSRRTVCTRQYILGYLWTSPAASI